MNWNQIADSREPFREKVKEKWPQVTDDDLTAIAGKRGQLVDLLQVRYGFNKAQAERELDELVRTVEPVNIPEPADTGATPASGGGNNRSLTTSQAIEKQSYKERTS